jgi:hypothetical protein
MPSVVAHPLTQRPMTAYLGPQESFRLRRYRKSVRFCLAKIVHRNDSIVCCKSFCRLRRQAAPGMNLEEDPRLEK